MIHRFKLQSSNKTHYTPLNGRSLRFPTITDTMVDNCNKYGEDGGLFQVINWESESSYKNQEFFDRQTHADQIVLQNDTEIMIETDNPNKFNNLRIKWAECGCSDPLVYCLELTLVS